MHLPKPTPNENAPPYACPNPVLVLPPPPFPNYPLYLPREFEIATAIVSMKVLPHLVPGAPIFRAEALSPPMRPRFERLAHCSLGLGGDIPAEEAVLYSRMKYGDPQATDEMARKLVDLLLKSGALMDLLAGEDSFCLAASAYGETPTAASRVVHAMLPLLREHVAEVHPIRFVRQGGFGGADYGQMDFLTRRAAMARRRIFIPPSHRKLLADKPLLLFDDLRSTGLHEAALQRVLSRKGLSSRNLFAYWVAFEDDLGLARPEREHELNSAAIRSLADLADLYNSLPEAPLLNSRVVKFVLSGGLNGGEDVREFLASVPRAIAEDIYRAARGNDGYQGHDRFREGFRHLSGFFQVPVL